MTLKIINATAQHLPWLTEAERAHAITPEQLKQKIAQQEVLVLSEGEVLIGWLRFGWFWDEIPFLNMLEIQRPYRRQGFGRKLLEHWEKGMQKEGHCLVLTSSQSDEQGQHFYRRLGYQDAGELQLPGEVPELLFQKRL